MPFPPTFDRAWDETFPPDTQLANLLGQDIRNFKTDIRERLSLLSGTFANRPANMDAIYGGSGFGILYFATDTQQLFQWNGAAWVQIGFNGNIVASANLTGQTASIPNTTLFTAVSAGIYRFTTNTEITTLGAVGSVVTNFTWNNGSQSFNLQVTSANTGNAATSEAAFQFPLYSAAGQNIGYTVTFNPGAGAVFSQRLRLEFLG